MAQTPQQKAYWDSIPDNTKLTPEMALASGFTQDAQGRWMTPEGHRYWTGGLGTKGGVARQVLKDTAKVAAIGSGIGLAAGLAGGGAAAATGATASPSLGAAGTPSELAALGGNAGAVTGGTAPALAGLGGAAATGGASGWASWLPKLAVVGAQGAGGLNNRSALKSAQEEQQAGTAAATQLQNQALQRSGDIYNQQRADTQNLFGQPFQTLGGLMGLTIAPIGPANGRIPTSAQPTGVPDGLNPNVPLTVPYPGSPAAAEPLGGPVAADLPMTLKQIAALSRRRTSQSGYGEGETAKGRP